MKPSSPFLQTHAAADLTLSQVRAWATLINLAFPDPPCPLDTRVEQFLDARRRRSMTVFVVWDGDTAIASALFFARDVLTEGGSLAVMALAAVCSAPDRRREGWGQAVVKAAWKAVDDGAFPIALFQTSVPDFYRKLGARIVDNRFVNTGELDPRPGRGTREQPWWNPHVMIYPAAYPWPTGTIDLRGPGY